jgi:hypothetical protein
LGGIKLHEVRKEVIAKTACWLYYIITGFTKKQEIARNRGGMANGMPTIAGINIALAKDMPEE